MPSSVDPSVIQSGPGKIHVDVISAASELFSSGASEIVASMAAVISQPFVQPSSVTFTASGSGDATRLLIAANGPYFVGDADLVDLFKVVNSSDDTEIFNRATGLYVSVASINVAQTGFAVSLTLTFNTPVPASLSYRVYYGRQISVGSIPESLGSFPAIRRSPDRARFPEFDRTGYAPTSISQAQNFNTSTIPDPYLAHWRAALRGNNVTSYNNSRGGAIGFVHVGSIANVLDGTGNDAFQDNLGTAFLAAYQKDVRSATFTTSPTATAWTKINPTLTATVSGNTVTLNAADYFRVAGPSSSLRLGVDMLEITYTSGTDSGRKMVVIPTAFDNANSRIVTCHTLGGATAVFSSVNCNVRWIRPNFFAGGAHGKFSSPEFNFVGMAVLAPGCITNQPGQEEEHVPPFFCSGTLDPARSGVNDWNIKALTWGSFAEVTSAVADLGKKTVKGELRGDGSIASFGGHVEGLHTQRLLETATISATGSYSWNPFTGSLLRIFLATATTKVVTLTLDAAYLADLKDGDQITLFIQHTSTSTANLASTFVWPSQFVFSGTDYDIRPSPVAGTVQPVLKYTGICIGGSFYMTRTDYEVT